MTFEIALNIIITACLGYITLNTFFRFHFTVDRIYLFSSCLVFLACLWYRGTEEIFESFITLGLIVLLTIILKVVSLKKKRHGYFLMNTYKKQYMKTKEDIYLLAKEFDIDEKHINYNKSKPWLVVFKETNLKTATTLVKKLDKIYTHQKLKFTMYNYWAIIIFLILMVLVWRF